MKNIEKKDTNRKIKIGDLMSKTGSSDEIKLDNKFCDNMDNMSDDGVSCQIYINSINKEDIRVKVKDIKCKLDINCDICGKSYIANIYSPEYTCIYTTDDKKISDPEEEQEYYLIENDTIDISDIVRFAINLELESTNRCEECNAKFEANGYQDDEDDYIEEVLDEGNTNITHHNNVIFKTVK